MMDYPAHFWDEYKTRNILSLGDRVAVIREFDSHLTKPSYQSLASKFDCSSKQIKNIILNRESILKSYQNAGQAKHEEIRDDVVQKRQEKIEFLGKVMYEYIQRVLYFSYEIDDEKVRQKALQIKECIAVENFQPTNAWLEDFKMTYGIPGFDLTSLRNNIHLTGSKRPHLSAIDMIQYVSRKEQEMARLHPMKGQQNRKSNSGGKAGQKRKSMPQYFDDQEEAQLRMLEPTIVYETLDDGEDVDVEVQVEPLHNNSNNYNNISGKQQYQLNVQGKNSVGSNKRKRSSSPLPDIESPDEALRHLKALEEYAMLQDNFRAIGLLTQLEQVFKKQPKKK